MLKDNYPTYQGPPLIYYNGWYKNKSIKSVDVSHKDLENIQSI